MCARVTIIIFLYNYWSTLLRQEGRRKPKRGVYVLVLTTLSLKRTRFNVLYKHASNQPTNKQTQQSIVLQKLAAVQTVKKFPAFYGTVVFITLLTRASQMTNISQTKSLHKLHPIYSVPVLILSSHLHLDRPTRLFQPKLCMHISPTHATCSAHLIFFFHHYNNNIQWRVQITSSLRSFVLPTPMCNLITNRVPHSQGLRLVFLNLFHGITYVILWKTWYGNYCNKN
jgi:hypothetical protein